ncbi:MAG TPA: aminotransferase class V-fold PLP-dependent enzyme [Candidatus Methylacidiphilales bacterium]|nr:aminotransferase class V-fold PLP-dependent enzyme [Candidatus Methylacidiphilales bacterium]
MDQVWVLDELLRDETLRKKHFPISRESIFLAHAGVTALPQAVVDEMHAEAVAGSLNAQEAADFMRKTARARKICADLVGGKPNEIALLGPTALGLSLVARGIDWKEGDEVIYYQDDYPANVYPWTDLKRLGVVPVPLKPEVLGRITPDLVSKAITSRTRLMALSSCHFLTGYRLDIAGISELAKKHNILFSLDGIQSLGATEVDASGIDFISADSHKWMLGPVGAGLFYVKEERMNDLRPALLGAWNVRSPNFIAAEEIAFEDGGRRYEPGTLYLHGIMGMVRSLELIQGITVKAIQERLLLLRAIALEHLTRHGLTIAHADAPPSAQCGIISIPVAGLDHKAMVERLAAEKVICSVRHDRQGNPYLRMSPHFYTTEAELGTALTAITASV